MEEIVLYHNNKCGKSRSALALLREKGLEPQLRYYLVDPPSRQQLVELLRKLGMKAEDLVRKNEPLYRNRFGGRTYSEEEWVDILAANPILVQRPVFIRGDRAVVGRPPEKVLELLD
jgi:arsenate reductase